MSWTHDLRDILIECWDIKGMSASQIMPYVGKTRSAIIGKVRRMGLSRRASSKTYGKPKPAKPRKPQSAKRMPFQYGRPPQSAMQPIEDISIQPAGSIERPHKVVCNADLTDKMCPFPYGDPKDDNFTYCGREKKRHIPYCRGHMGIAYQPYKAPPRPSRRGKQGYKSRMRA